MWSSIPSILIVLVGIYFFIKQDKSEVKIPKTSGGGYIALLICCAIGFIWVFLSEQGGFVNQVGDWAKHNLILSSLIDNNWPVCIATDKEQGILVYYFAYYLLPALVEKISGGLVRAPYFMLLWTLAGLLIVVKVWGDYIKIDKPLKYIVVWNYNV